MRDIYLPESLRVSTGSAIVLGLLKGRLDAKPTTVYLLMCRKEKCSANCGFCPQARESKGRGDRLSRITWPTFMIEKVVDSIERTTKSGRIKRICIQSLNYLESFNDVLFFIKKIRTRVNLPISVSSKPLDIMKIKKLKNIGVDRISFALDAVTEQIFSKVKGENIGGPFSWKKHREALHDAVRVLGEGSVSTHLIVGLGETEKELCQTIQWCVDSGIYPGLFAFTPISGTTLENNPQPTLTNYRRIQLAQYLITNRKTRIENMEFDTNETLKNFGIHQKNLLEIIDNGKPFLTSGCPGCNRPYYNESPSGPTYNFPRQLQPKEIEKVKKSLNF